MKTWAITEIQFNSIQFKRTINAWRGINCCSNGHDFTPFTSFHRLIVAGYRRVSCGGPEEVLWLKRMLRVSMMLFILFSFLCTIRCCRTDSTFFLSVQFFVFWLFFFFLSLAQMLLPQKMTADVIKLVAHISIIFCSHRRACLIKQELC